jgi:hypoxanthine phosphoribosyltransferase
MTAALQESKQKTLRHTVDTLLHEHEIRARVQEIADRITADYPDYERPLLLIGVLKGAAVFLADLVRMIQRPVEYDFVAYSSYGMGTSTSGSVRVLKDVTAEIAGKDVVIVEDILDTGLTLRFSYLVENLLSQNAASVRVCVLLDKPTRRQVQVKIDYCGFVIDDLFVVGYGMDYAEAYRNLPYIGIVRQDKGGGDT